MKTAIRLLTFFILLLFINLFLIINVLAAEGDILFFDDFNDGNMDGWTVETGNWYVDDNNLLTMESGVFSFRGQIHAGDTQWDNYKIEVDINNEVGVDEGIDFRRLDDANYYAFNLRHGPQGLDAPLKLFKIEDNNIILLQSTTNVEFLNNTWYHIKVEVINENIKFFVNDNLILEYSDTGTNLKNGAIGLYSWTGGNGFLTARFDNVKVTALGSTPPEPFLDLPWDYQGKGLNFNEAALNINSYFDHEYPFLSSGLAEPPDVSNSIINFYGPPQTDDSYSSHDGYDYGKPAKVNINDPVLAAAAGEATFTNSCSACGNAILIDHGNGYQTRYYHLPYEGLITNIPGQKVTVTSGQQIGKVGATGNVSPKGDAGAHIHFMVVQDKNNDGNFEDNLPDGVTDPFGWQSKESDPWPLYSFFYNDQQRTGNTSFYLWKNKLDHLDASLTSNGGIFNVGRYTLNFPEGITDQTLGLSIDSSPTVQPSNSLSSIGSTIIATATDSLGNLVTQFQSLFTLTVDFSSFDLSRFKTDTISFYSSSDGVNWTQEPTTVDLISKTATTQVDHMTYFALMAERADTTSPQTTAVLSGDQGLENWFRSDVQFTLNAQDNEGGLGVDYTLYKIDGEDWQIYQGPINITTEGHHKIEFYSADNDENLEEIKSIEFDIDKTPPEAKIFINQIEKDLVVRGVEQNPVMITKLEPLLYILRDKAGNTLKMAIVDFDGNKLDLFRIYSLQYNDNPIIFMGGNFYNVIYPLGEQNFTIKDEVIIRIKFNPLNNQSVIVIKQAGEEIVKEIRDGLVFLQVVTNQGNLEYSY